MKRTTHILAMLCIAGICIHAWPDKSPSDPKKAGIDSVRMNTPVFLKALDKLQASLVRPVRKDSAALSEAMKDLEACRVQYKKLSYLLEYYFPYEAVICNGPPVPDPEEDEVTLPHGMQVIESLLSGPDPWSHQSAYEAETQLMQDAIQKLMPLLGDVNTTDAAFLQSLNLELVRIMTLYITGFDAPKLKTGIAEAYASFNAVAEATLPYCKDKAERDSLWRIMENARQLFNRDSSFNSFDRIHFLTKATLPLQGILHRLRNRADGRTEYFTALDSDAENLFAPGSISAQAFPHSESAHPQVLLDLGRKLFHEKALSVNFSRSCASCHNPDQYFTDGMVRNHTLNATGSLSRNTPTLLYAGMQYMQFWDGRVSSIEEQVKTVLNNPIEMGSSEQIIVDRLQKDSGYVKAFTTGWPDDPVISLAHIGAALAAYVRSLAPFTSPFDSYIRGNAAALTSEQQAGFICLWERRAAANVIFRLYLTGCCLLLILRPNLRLPV